MAANMVTQASTSSCLPVFLSPITVRPAFSSGSISWASDHWITTSGFRARTLSTLGVKSCVAISCGSSSARGNMVPMMPSRIATQDALCIALRCSALRSTATSSDAAGMGMVTTLVTGLANVRVLPRWSVMLMPWLAVPGTAPAAGGGRSGRGAGGPAPGEKGCGSARHQRLKHRAAVQIVDSHGQTPCA